ncbi:MAG: hypothetical protein ABIH85_04730 [Candidatus Omnitrophota bacterium]|nr:hypothetical protein [Candidatus Omnitrophota bacterium]MBU1895125.1 hypothetical protein [Candidatus Omnitrophota bacterium]
MKTIICLSMFLVILNSNVAICVSEEKPQETNVSVKPMHWENSEMESEIAESLPPGEKIKQTPRYKARLRDLERAYEAGEFTRTEYVQRRRELDAISEKVKE